MYTFQDLRERKCAVINDGSVQQLITVMTTAFPESESAKSLTGDHRYYMRAKIDHNNIVYSDSYPLIPAQSVYSFIEQLYYDNEYTIDDLKNGKCAIKNDGTTEELRAVLLEAFPKDRRSKCPLVIYEYYFRDPDCEDEWVASNTFENIPVVSVKRIKKQHENPLDALKTKFEPKYGDEVLVSKAKTMWFKAYYVDKLENGSYLASFQKPTEENKDDINYRIFNYIKPSKIRISKSALARYIGCDVESIEFTD